MNNYVVYKHTAPNGKVYIGQTGTKPEQRWKKDGKGYISSPLFYNAIQKYGWDNFKHEIISKNLSLKEANWLENYLIRYYNSDNRKYGYNILGGGHNTQMPDETRKKISESNKGKQRNLGRHHTEEAKRKIGEASKGRKTWLGKQLSEEHKQHLRKPKPKFKWLTPEGDIRYMSKANVGNHHPDWKLID